MPEPVIQPTLPIERGLVIPIFPGPQANYRASCEAEADHQGAGPSPVPAFIASVLFDSTADTISSYRITATWYLPEGRDITRIVTRQVQPRAKATATIVVPATPAEISANRAIASGAPCTIAVTLLNAHRFAY